MPSRDKFCYWPTIEVDGTWFVTGCGKSTRLSVDDYFKRPCPFCGRPTGLFIDEEFPDPDFADSMPLPLPHTKA